MMCASVVRILGRVIAWSSPTVPSVEQPLATNPLTKVHVQPIAARIYLFFTNLIALPIFDQARLKSIKAEVLLSNAVKRG